MTRIAKRDGALIESEAEQELSEQRAVIHRAKDALEDGDADGFVTAFASILMFNGGLGVKKASIQSARFTTNTFQRLARRYRLRRG